MKSKFLILIFSLLTKSILGQDIEDSLLNLYKPNFKIIIKNKIKTIEYIVNNLKTIENYNYKTGNLTEIIQLEKVSLCAPNKSYRDSLLPIKDYLYFYSGNHLDSIVYVEYNRHKNNSYRYAIKYDLDGRIICDSYNLRYKGKIKFYTVDSGNMKMNIIAYPELDKTKIFCWNDIRTKPDTTKCYYDYMNRIIKIENENCIKTFNYKNNLIIIEKNNKGNYTKTEYSFKKNNLIKVTEYNSKNIKSSPLELYFTNKYFYKNNLLYKIFSKRYGEFSDSGITTKVIITKANNKN